MFDVRRCFSESLVHKTGFAQNDLWRDLQVTMVSVLKCSNFPIFQETSKFFNLQKKKHVVQSSNGCV